MYKNDYFRKRNLNDYKLIRDLNREIINIAGIEFKYIFKNTIIDNTLLREATNEFVYQNAFSTLAQLETATFQDSQLLINEFNMFVDDRVRVLIDYQSWLEDVRTHLNDQEYDEPPTEGDLMIMVNEDYSYDIFEIASVYRYDYYLQFNDKIIYRVFLKKYGFGEGKMEGFEAVSEIPAELKMQQDVTNAESESAPDPINTPSYTDFNIDNLDDLL